MNTVNGIVENSIQTRVTSSESRLKKMSEPGKFEKTLSEITSAKKDPKAKLDKKLWETCQEAESLFVSKMFKEMRKTVEKSDWMHGGFAEEIFEDMLYDEYSLQLSKNSTMGMAKLLYDEMSRNL